RRTKKNDPRIDWLGGGSTFASVTGLSELAKVRVSGGDQPASTVCTLLLHISRSGGGFARHSPPRHRIRSLSLRSLGWGGTSGLLLVMSVLAALPFLAVGGILVEVSGTPT